jgi:hypothetical protein
MSKVGKVEIKPDWAVNMKSYLIAYRKTREDRISYALVDINAETYYDLNANRALAQFWEAHTDTDEYNYKILAITEGE